MHIIVNGKHHDIPRGQIDYATIAALAGYPDDQYLSVTYHGKRHGDTGRSGILIPGKSIDGDDGMVFNAVNTGNA